MRMLLPEPWGRCFELPLLFQKRVHAVPIRGFGQQLLQAILRDGLQDPPGILCRIPQLRFQLAPQLVGGMIPAL